MICGHPDCEVSTKNICLETFCSVGVSALDAKATGPSSWMSALLNCIPHQSSEVLLVLLCEKIVPG